MARRAYIKDVDKGYKDLKRRLLKFKNKPHVKIGIIGAAAASIHPGSDNLSLSEVASFHEFGLGNNPERSFIRETVDINQQRIKQRIKKEIDAVTAHHRDASQALQRIGLLVRGLIQQRMGEGIPPPNVAATIAAKGSSTPLIDTGHLRASIDYEVKLA